ncbi:MAG TPA: hypothetical protein VHI98_12485 [Vicinamibacterales bacterium]|jgi:hypothetical protein|nr:hypothetical protein [Vicinamibacterales bacterium]
MMTRRRFIGIAALCGAPIAAGSLVWSEPVEWLYSRTAQRIRAFLQSPEERLRAHFDYLELDPDSVRSYFADCGRYRHGFSRRLPLAPDVYTNYLLSTDFFRHGGDESRRVRYVGYYDPAVTPCNNPLARFDS